MFAIPEYRYKCCDCVCNEIAESSSPTRMIAFVGVVQHQKSSPDLRYLDGRIMRLEQYDSRPTAAMVVSAYLSALEGCDLSVFFPSLGF